MPLVLHQTILTSRSPGGRGGPVRWLRCQLATWKVLFDIDSPATRDFVPLREQYKKSLCGACPFVGYTVVFFKINYFRKKE